MKRTLSLCGLLSALAVWFLPYAALAQEGVNPAHLNLDSMVDVTTGKLYYSTTEVTIGGELGLSQQRIYSNGWVDPLNGYFDPATNIVNIGATSEKFTLSGGVYTTTMGSGSTLTKSGSVFTYKTADGTTATFQEMTGCQLWNKNNILTLTYPNGKRLDYIHKTSSYSYLGFSVCADRIQSVLSNTGYQLKYSYAYSTASGLPDASSAFLRRTQVTGINRAVEYCDPAADYCYLTGYWPEANYSISGSPQVLSVSGNGGADVTKYQVTSSTFKISTPVQTLYNYGFGYTVNIDSNGRVSSIVTPAGTTNYSFSLSGTTMTMVRTDALSHTRTVVSNTTIGQVTSDTDALGRATTYSYDSYGRPTLVTAPDGSSVSYVYDGRGNVTSTTRTPASGSGLSSITTTADFDSTCTYIAKCNKPNWTRDPDNNQTDYTYDTTHGGVLTVTLPAPVTSGVRPKTTTTYSSLQAYFKNSGGSFVASGYPIYLPTSTVSCQTTSSCSGTSDETKVLTTYGSTGVANNLAPTSVTVQAGDGSVSSTTAMTYDDRGHLATMDGPLSGTGDTTRYRNNLFGQIYGIVSPASSTGTYSATRYTRDADGQVISTELGTVTSQSDSDWTNTFVSAQELRTSYDYAGREVASVLRYGSVPLASTDRDFDAAGRVICVAERIASAYGVTSACTPGTPSSDGADRITKYTYNNADQPLTVKDGCDSSTCSRTVQTLAYNSYGQLTSVTDANSHATAYEYDGFGRLKKTTYADSTYEQVTFKANGQVDRITRRDTTYFDPTYDLLGRQTNAPGSGTVTYNNFGQLLTASRSSQTLTNTYDALGRLTSAQGPLGTIGYVYDAAGRRTQMNYPGGGSFSVTYAYDNADNLTSISQGSTTLASYGYDGLGRLTSKSYGNGAGRTNTYSSARLSGLSWDLPGSSGDQSLGFTYRYGGQIKARTYTNSTFVPEPTSSSTTNYTAGVVNQITNSGFSYNGNGALTADNVSTFGYNALNQLTSLNGGAATLAYDPADRLFQTYSSGTGTTKFLYDGSDLIAEYDGSGNVLRRYVHGPGADEPTAWYEGSGTGTLKYLTQDERGSVVAVSDSGTSPALNTYDEYGQPGSSNIGRFQYTGQTWIPEAGLYYYKARFYSPSLGRFMTPDPAGYEAGDMNLYAYVGDDPINLTDPTGMYSDDISELMVQAEKCSASGAYYSQSAGKCQCYYGQARVDRKCVNVNLPTSGAAQGAGPGSGAGGVGGGSSTRTPQCGMPPQNVCPPPSPLATPLPTTLAQAQQNKQCVQLPAGQSIYHRFDGECGNIKYVCNGGHDEVVFRPDGLPTTNANNRGTPNKYDPNYLLGLPHFVADVIPYYVNGSPGGTTPLWNPAQGDRLNGARCPAN